MEELLVPFYLRLLSPEARQRGEVLTLRLVCPCGRIHQIFDSALHGYDAVCGELAAAAEDAWQPQWRELPLPEGTVAVEAELVRDVPEEELRGLSPEECANAFGCIRLRSMGGQRRVLFEHESA